MTRTAVINVVGLTEIAAWRSHSEAEPVRQNGQKSGITPAFPAVTCTAQSTYPDRFAPGPARNRWQWLV